MLRKAILTISAQLMALTADCQFLYLKRYVVHRIRKERSKVEILDAFSKPLFIKYKNWTFDKTVGDVVSRVDYEGHNSHFECMGNI